VDRLLKKYRGRVDLSLLTVDLSVEKYLPLTYPIEAVRTNELRNNILLTELNKHKETETQHEQMLSDMKAMTLKVRR
jgi:hypothetical protein